MPPKSAETIKPQTSITYATTYKWQIQDFRQLCYANETGPKYSTMFALYDEPSIKFVFFVYNRHDICSDPFGIMLKELGDRESVDLQIKFWFENEAGHMIGESRFVERQTFRIGDKYKALLKYKDELQSFDIARKFQERVFICCELKVLDLVQKVKHVGSESKLRQQLWAQYKEGIDCDVIIEADGQTFAIAHNILTSQSKLFAKFLLSNPNKMEFRHIRFNKVKAATVKAFIEWLYLGTVPLDEHVEHLYVLGHKCFIDDLQQQGSEWMIDGLTKKNAAKRLVTSASYRDTKLQDRILDFIARLEPVEYLQIFQSGPWSKFLHKDKNTADKVLKLFYAKIR